MKTKKNKLLFRRIKLSLLFKFKLQINCCCYYSEKFLSCILNFDYMFYQTDIQKIIVKTLEQPAYLHLKIMQQIFL